MLGLWQMYRGGGMGGGHLPDRGGAGDQAAIVMDGFRVMDAALAELEEDEERRRRGRSGS